MGKTKLFIRSNQINSKGTTVIYLRYSHKDKAIDISTGELIPPSMWDTRHRVVKKSYKGFTALNDYLKKVTLDVEAIRLSIQTNGGNPMPAEVKRRYLEKLNPKEIVQPKPDPAAEPFLAHWDSFVNTKKSKGEINNRTYDQYKATRKNLNDFTEFSNTNYTLGNLDSNFYDQFLIYLYDHQCVNPNTAGNRIKQLKVYLSWCVENNLTTNTRYTKFKRPSCPVISVALTQQQLDTIVNLDLSQRRELELSKDLFVFGCSTGYRFSDFKEVKKEHVKGDFLLKIINKTSETLKIPLNDYSRFILQKYNFELPNVDEAFNATMNLHLKEIGKLAGFFDPVEYIDYTGNKQSKTISPYWEFMSTHCARRTYATQSLKRGVPVSIVMKCTGHKDHRSFFQYLRPTEDELLEIAGKPWNTLPVQDIVAYLK